MRFLNPSLPDGIYSGHVVADGATVEDFPELTATLLVRVLTRYYGLVPEESTPKIEAALADIGYEAPQPPFGDKD